MPVWMPVQVRHFSRALTKPEQERIFRTVLASSPLARQSRAGDTWKTVALDDSKTPDLAFRRVEFGPARSGFEPGHQQDEEREAVNDVELGHDAGVEAGQARYAGFSQGSSNNESQDFRNMRSAKDLPKSPLLQRYADYKQGSLHENKRNRTARKSASNGHSVEQEEQLPRIQRGRPTLFKKLMKHAPFATRFQMNAFAHALAVPVREDCFSGAHLPISCLVDFKIINTDAGERALLPVSLAAELIPIKRALHKMTKEEIQIREAYQEELHTPRQTFAGSYVLNSQEAVQFVTEDSPKRVPRMVLSRRVNISISDNIIPAEMTWRDDMPEFLLDGIRKVALKKLGYLIRAKGNKDKPGMVCAVPGEGLEFLDGMPDVTCVLRLRPSAVPDKREQEDGDEMLGYNLHSNEFEPGSPEDIEAQHASSDITAAFDERELAAKAEAEDSPDTDDAEEGSALDNPEDNDEQPTTPRTGALAPRSAWWTDSEPFHRDTRPLAPPIKPPILHYPSVRYRRRRIPLYDLPTLLGDEVLEKMLKGTVFDGTMYVAVKHALGTIAAAVWLVKLQAYVAQRRVRD